MSAGRHVALRALARIGENNDASFITIGGGENGVEVGVKASGDDEHGGAEFIERHEHLFGGLGLRDDAHLVFNGQHLGNASAENCLIIGQNKLQHGSRSRYELRTNS